MPIINLTRPHVGSVVFDYTGEYSIRRDSLGRKVVRLTTSGTFTWLSGEVEAEVFMLAGGGSPWTENLTTGPWYEGGGGGWRLLSTRLSPGTYDIVIGEGSTRGTDGIGSAGGDTVAFGCRCTGGQPATGGGFAPGTPKPDNPSDVPQASSGRGGEPNGEVGVPNGGYYSGPLLPEENPGDINIGNNPREIQGGPGYVDITFY